MTDTAATEKFNDKPKIVTACWFAKLGPGHAPIGISRGVPRGMSGYQRYDSLNPLREGFHAPLEVFTRIYNEHVLGVLQPELVVRNLMQMAEGRTPVLLCWEHPPPNPKPCHRALVSIWLFDRMGLEVYELGHEREGCGLSHPKLDASVRKKPERRNG